MPDTEITLPRVTIAIVTYRSGAELPDCLDSVLASDIPLKIVVIDNSPGDDRTLEIAQQYAAKHENLTAFSSGGNIGLAAANNLVMPYIEGDYVLMLNPDTIVRPNTISSMVATLERDPLIGVVGPKNVYGNGQPFASYQHSWNLGHVILWRVFPYSFTRWMYDRWSSYAESEVFYVSGACLLIRSQLFREIGGYDPEFFLTIEDVCDLCRRVKEHGYKTVFSPRTELIHYCSRSGDQVPYLATLCTYIGSIYYFKKYNGNAGGYAAYAIVTLGCIIKIIISSGKVILFRRPLDRKNFRVYWQILPELLRRGPKITLGTP